MPCNDSLFNTRLTLLKAVAHSTMAELESLPQTTSQTSPPLGIQHLLLWTACSAVLLTASLALNQAMELRIGISLVVEKFVACARAFPDGLAVAGLLICVARRWRGVHFPVQPGEWLLVLGGISVLVVMFGQAILFQLPQQEDQRAYQVLIIPVGLMAGGYVIAAIWPPLPMRWHIAILAMSLLWCIEFGQAVLLSNIVNYAPEFLYDLLGLLFWAALIVPMIVLVVCLVMDYARHIQRGWMHWTGVTSCIAGLLLWIDMQVYIQWVRV